VPKILTEAQVQSFQGDGLLTPVRAMSAERARHYRERFESLEARVPDIKKMKTKSHLLCPWVLDIAEDPYILDIFEDLIGPNLRCWSMAWRVKKADGETFAGWHQDSFYGSAVPVVLGALALSECGSRQGCLRGIPGSHRWGILRHEETDDPKSILARGQYITEPFDESKAVDFELRPGEMAMFDNSLVHGSWKCCRRRRSRRRSASPRCSCAASTPMTTSTTSRDPTASTPRPRSRTGAVSWAPARGSCSRTAGTARARPTAGRDPRHNSSRDGSSSLTVPGRER